MSTHSVLTQQKQSAQCKPAPLSEYKILKRGGSWPKRYDTPSRDETPPTRHTMQHTQTRRHKLVQVRQEFTTIFPISSVFRIKPPFLTLYPQLLYNTILYNNYIIIYNIIFLNIESFEVKMHRLTENVAVSLGGAVLMTDLLFPQAIWEEKLVSDSAGSGSRRWLPVYALHFWKPLKPVSDGEDEDISCYVFSPSYPPYQVNTHQKCR